MALNRSEWAASALASAVALAMPMVMLWPDAAPSVAPAATIRRPLTIATTPPLSAVFARSVFATGETAGEDALPDDAPRLIGIAGRIGSDAVALVRGGDGTGRTLAVGASVDGWMLESLAIDAAYFTRGNQRVRVPLPAG